MFNSTVFSIFTKFTTIATIYFQHILIAPRGLKETPSPLAVTHTHPQGPGTQKPTLWICLFWTLHVNEITCYVVLCVWLLKLH